MELTAKKVNDLFVSCLFKPGENTDAYKMGQAVMMKVGFHPERLKEAEPDIIALLDQLPDEFKEGGGGGWSFLNMVTDKHGNQWADLHKTVDELVALGNAIGKLTFMLPRQMWETLPGGMPYLVVNK